MITAPEQELQSASCLCRNKWGVGESTGDAKSGLHSPKIGWQILLNLKCVEPHFFVRLLRTPGLMMPGLACSVCFPLHELHRNLNKHVFSRAVRRVRL